MKRFLLFLALLACAAVPARAELTADQVAIIAMKESPESVELAKHYAKARGINESRILLLEDKPARTISREVWETKTRPAVRKWLEDHQLDDKIRCFVTCGDVPLKIGRRAADSPEIVEREKYLAEARRGNVKQIEQLVSLLESLGRGDKPKPIKPLDPEISLRDVGGRLEGAVATAQGQIMAIPGDEKRLEAMQKFQQLLTAIGGGSQVLRMAAAQAKGGQLSPEQAMPLRILESRLQGLQQGIQALTMLPPTVARDTQLLNLIRMSAGLTGSLGWIDKERESLAKNETYSSFDSELALVRWNDYPLDRWQPNLLYQGYGVRGAGTSSVLIVSRLAAPTLALAKGLVDKAIAAEKSGLSGKVYLDARGMKFDKEKSEPGSYDAYDQSLRDLAERIKKHTKLEVVLDDKPELFQPGKCPDAALYCGWYSLSKYVDAFEWRPGAVGYHLASAEATTLTTPGGTAWCNAMLEDGITATLGPVYEPYLHSFPKPDEFFSLLLTGKYCLADVYARTNPYNSWVMVLVGDPL
ncbi:MAG TPA: TIGR03790 family protein, partial [Thermoguttaceae bacterium]|nr:TIGR03790 family protein [Thermoguttaceae bacterium]